MWESGKTNYVYLMKCCRCGVYKGFGEMIFLDKLEGKMFRLCPDCYKDFEKFIDEKRSNEKSKN